MTLREELHKVIDILSPRSLEHLKDYAEYLYFKEQGDNWFGKLVELFEPVRDSIAASGITEEAINQAIDEAIAEVRRERKD